MKKKILVLLSILVILSSLSSVVFAGPIDPEPTRESYMKVKGVIDPEPTRESYSYIVYVIDPEPTRE